jgi:hypothetical protein
VDYVAFDMMSLLLLKEKKLKMIVSCNPKKKEIKRNTLPDRYFTGGDD